MGFQCPHNKDRYIYVWTSAKLESSPFPSYAGLLVRFHSFGPPCISTYHPFPVPPRAMSGPPIDTTFGAAFVALVISAV